MALPTASDNAFPSLLLNETTAPSAPAASKRRLYVDANHVLRWLNSSSLDSPLVALNKWNATAAPGASDDSTAGYAVGSRWVDITAKKEYVCLDSTAGTAVWTETTQAGGFDPDVHMPRTVSIIAGAGSYSNVNCDTITSATGQEPTLASSGAQNDEVVWKVPLAAGTWSVFLTYHRYTSRGIATVYFDATSVGAVDMYGADAQYIKGSITGITVAATAVVAVKIKMATKNASSSGYGCWLDFVGLIRTA